MVIIVSTIIAKAAPLLIMMPGPNRSYIGIVNAIIANMMNHTNDMIKNMR